MQNYKDLSNMVHVLDDPNYEYLLPVGCVPITPAEAQVLQDAYNELIITPAMQRAALYPNMQLFLEQYVAGTQQQKQAFIDNIKAIITAHPGC